MVAVVGRDKTGERGEADVWFCLTGLMVANFCFLDLAHCIFVGSFLESRMLSQVMFVIGVRVNTIFSPTKVTHITT